jgi:hypothetical protein
MGKRMRAGILQDNVHVVECKAVADSRDRRSERKSNY